MLATLFASRARNISNSTAGINYKSKSLRGCPDPQTSCIIPIKKEIVVEGHPSVWRAAVLEMAARIKAVLVAVVVVVVEKQRQKHGSTITTNGTTKSP